MSQAPRNVLAIIISRIGDTLLCTPALRALKAKWPDSELTVLAHPKRMEVLANLPAIDHLCGFTRGLRWRSALMARKEFDLAFAFSNELPVLRHALARAQRVLAFRSADAARIDGVEWVDFPSEPMHAVPARLKLAAAAGAESVDLRLAYVVTPEEAAWAGRWLQTHVPSAAGPLVALQLRSFPTKAHRDWPIESFAHFIELARAEYPGAAFLITGDAQSQAPAATLAARFGSAIVCAAGTLSLRQTAALLARMGLYVGVDTGPTHLAGALGIPMVALYHAAYPGRYLAPLQHPRCVAIEHPGTGRDGALAANMGDIAARTVWDAARPLLAAGAQ